MFVGYGIGDIGEVTSIGSPLHLSGSSGDVRLPPPGPGVHNDEVLSGVLGYSEERVARLVEAGVLWGWEDPDDE
jgi:crotonobetainyl-CoA:carnitine CoA-transferase CaiB-like acyl-CoA transferase